MSDDRLMRVLAPTLGAVAMLVLAGCVAPSGGSGDNPASRPRASETARSTPSSPAPAPSSGTPTVAGNAASTLRTLATIPVKGRAPLTGYDRDEFGSAWTDDNDDVDGHNGCDTRNDVLRRDLTDVTLKPDTHGCLVLTGVLHDPYTATTIQFVRGVGTSNAVQVDHVVALGNAWQTGAQYWPEAKRVDFANDPLELLAVDGSANESKGDGDTATWLPPNTSYRCAYVERQVAVKARYGLWTTPAEHAAMSRTLDRYCQ